MKMKKKIYRKKAVLLRPMYFGVRERGRFSSAAYGHSTTNQDLSPADLSVMPFPISSSGDGCIYSSSIVVQSSRVSSEKCSQNQIVQWNRLVSPFYSPSKSTYSCRGDRLLLRRSECSGSCCISRSSASSESSQSCRCRRERPSKILAKKTEPRFKRKEIRRYTLYKANKDNPVSGKWILSRRYSLDEANMRKTDLTAESGNCSLVTIENRSKPSKRDKLSDKINNYHLYMMRGSIFKMKLKKPHKRKGSREWLKDKGIFRIKKRLNECEDSECESTSRMSECEECGLGREHEAREVKQDSRDKELRASLNDLKSKIEKLRSVLYPREGVDSQPENEQRSKPYGCSPIYVISCENLRQCLLNVQTRERGVQYGTEEVLRVRTTDTSVMTDEKTLRPTTVEVSTSSEFLEQSYDEQPFYNQEEDLSDLELPCECFARNRFLADELGRQYRASRWPGGPFDQRLICLCGRQQEYGDDRLDRRSTRLYTAERRNQATDYQTQCARSAVEFDRDLRPKSFADPKFCHCYKQRPSAKKSAAFLEPTADNRFSTTSVQTRLPRSFYREKHFITCRNSNSKNSTQNSIHASNKVFKCPNCKLTNSG